jgi:hypothetical protein
MTVVLGDGPLGRRRDAPARDLTITWQPISLFFKNEPEPGTDYHDPVLRSHKHLRVLESVRTDLGNDGVQSLYWELGRRNHHDRDRGGYDIADALDAVGIDRRHGDAMDDESFDAEIRTRMDAGLALTGQDVGTPIIAFDNADGDKVALFGPVITRVPPTELSLQLWDGFIAVATVPGFWELKRTRTEKPDFGERP